MGEWVDTAKDHAALLAANEQYGLNIAAWLRAKLPDVCNVDPRMIESERKAYGNALADRLARCATPNPAAIAAVVRLHHRHGRGTLSVAEHGAEIRAAARAFNERAVADYQLIAAKRDHDRDRERDRERELSIFKGGVHQ